jgi:hypothetical protein
VRGMRRLKLAEWVQGAEVCARSACVAYQPANVQGRELVIHGNIVRRRVIGMLGDKISKELRAVEKEVDYHHRQNALMTEPFGRAGWYFLAFCEERIMFSMLQEDPITDHQYGAVVDNLIIHAQWPLKWLTQACLPGGEIPRAYEENLYTAAWQLSELAMQYRSFAAAFSFATWGLATLSLDGRRIKSASPMRSDTRFEAYDRLITHEVPTTLVNMIDTAFSERIAASVRVHGDSFDYELTPQIARSGVEALAPFIDLRFELPTDWQFPRFSLNQFQRVASVLWVLAFVHFQARVTAAEHGCKGLGFSRALLLMGNDELLRRVRRYSGVSEETVRAILEMLTYGARDQSNPDPALQPLIPLSSSVVAITPSLLLNTSMERNFAVLLNRLPEEKSAYSALSHAKEKALRERLVEELLGLRFRFWHGNVPEWGTASEIDFAIVSDEERQCLMLELKSFIAPAEPREIHERSDEIRKGIRQVRDRMEMARTLPDPLRVSLAVNAGYSFTWAVASETSIGAVYVQTPEVPVVNVQHLLARLRGNPELAACCLWLRDGDYLPIEGLDYETLPIEDTVGNWTLEWYAIRGITEDYLHHDRPLAK